MKTILVVYTSIPKVTKELSSKKKYSFNVDSDLYEGDVIETNSYKSFLVVVKILPECFKYYNIQTGEISNTFNSASQFEIRTLFIKDKLVKSEDIIGVLVNRTKPIEKSIENKFKITL